MNRELESEIVSLIRRELHGRSSSREDIGDRELLERMVRVEEALLHHGKMMEQRFEAMDKRFETIDKRFEDMYRYMDKRFEAVDKRFETMDKRFEDMYRYMDKRFEDMKHYFNRLFWMVSAGFTTIVILMSLYKFL